MLKIIIIFILSIVLTILFSALYFTKRTRKKVSYMLDALEDNELNFRFDESKLTGHKFNKTLNRIRNIFDRERLEIREQERYYAEMLNYVQTGIIVLKFIDNKKTSFTPTTNTVEYCNNYALELLGIPSLTNIRQLGNISVDIAEAFNKVTKSYEQRATYYNETERKTIAITAHDSIIKGNKVKIIAFNDISDEIEESREQSWNRLIRVLTHEIMNTVTPIASLSEALAQHINKNNYTSHEYDHIKSGLEAISTSTKGLIRFVESYRCIARINTPLKKPIMVRELINNVFHLVEKQNIGHNIKFEYIEKTEDVLLYADWGQITQILVNLIKNAIQAEANKINITAEIDNRESVIINVNNNGNPVNKDNSEEIFVPFFTTKQDGSGIGLSLSRQIMRMHNGTLTLTNSDNDITTFTLIFK